MSMAFLQYPCGECHFTTSCPEDRMRHRIEEHPDHFRIYGRCGVCLEFHSDVFSFVDHFEQFHPRQWMIVLEEGRRLLPLSIPPPLFLLLPVFIGIDEELDRDYAHTSTLLLLVRKIV
ncbi:hypothetical protein PMAYCL1PPCAC_28988, partial [Pristionchus mayeri]